jgi:hypothetical protein
MMPWSSEYITYEKEQKQRLFWEHNQEVPPEAPKTPRKKDRQKLQALPSAS